MKFGKKTKLFSEALLDNPHCFSRNRNCIIAKRLEVELIDSNLLPKILLERTTQLDLSKNKLNDTKGIAAFTNLESLNLAYNNISSLSDVLILSERLLKLKSLRVAGNGICKLPLVKEYIIASFLSLCELDGVKITIAMRKTTHRVMECVNSNLRMLLPTLESKERLELLLNVLLVHTELLRTVDTFPSTCSDDNFPPHSPFSVTSFLQKFRQTTGLCQEVSRDREVQVLRQISKLPELQLYSSLSREPPTKIKITAWSNGFGKIAMNLQSALSALLTRVETAASQYNSVKRMAVPMARLKKAKHLMKHHGNDKQVAVESYRQQYLLGERLRLRLPVKQLSQAFLAAELEQLPSSPQQTKDTKRRHSSAIKDNRLFFGNEYKNSFDSFSNSNQHHHTNETVTPRRINF